jgi:hypothetical protein
VMAFHGTADTLVTYDAGTLSGEMLNVPDTVKAWATRDGCTTGPDTTYQMGTVTCQTWSGCRAGGDGDIEDNLPRKSANLCSAWDHDNLRKRSHQLRSPKHDHWATLVRSGETEPADVPAADHPSSGKSSASSIGPWGP